MLDENAYLGLGFGGWSFRILFLMSFTVKSETAGPYTLREL